MMGTVQVQGFPAEIAENPHSRFRNRESIKVENRRLVE